MSKERSLFHISYRNFNSCGLQWKHLNGFIALEWVFSNVWTKLSLVTDGLKKLWFEGR